jgi:spore maturation protein CgeB
MLFASEFTVWQTAAGLAQGFRLLGWDIVEVSTMDPIIHSRRIDLRAAGRLLYGSMRKSFNEDLLREADATQPDVMLTVKGNFITAATLRELRRRGIFTVNFYPDYKFEHGHGFNEALVDEYDLFITTKSFQVDYLTQRLGPDRVAMIHHGYVPDIHRRRTPPGTAPTYLWDVSFIGNASPDKLAWLEPVARALGDRTMVVIGNNWEQLAAGTAVAPYVLGRPLVGDQFARAIEHSRINIAVHHGVGGAQGWADAVSTRSFEIPACGGFMLHIDNAEIRTLYEPGREIDVFADPAQLVSQIKRYLNDETGRQAIADAGHARAVPAYSLHARAIEVVSEMTRHGVAAS